MSDPTYDKKQINANPIWKTAWIIAQCKDDAAPMGWSKWIWVAEELHRNGLIKGKTKK